jgi:hypothetical protein
VKKRIQIGMVGEIYGGITAFKAMLDITRNFKDIADAVQRNAVALELQEKILAAQAAQQSLLAERDELAREVKRLKDWSVEKQNYEIKDIGQGCVAYALKTENQASNPEHYLCANCFEDVKKRFLQRERLEPGRVTRYVCHDCGAAMYTEGMRDVGLDKNNRRRS